MGPHGALLWVRALQEEGVLFLPFEQRMTRDIQQWRERRSARRGKGSGMSSAAPTVRDASASKASLLRDLPSGPSDAMVRNAWGLKAAALLNSQIVLAQYAREVSHQSGLEASCSLHDAKHSQHATACIHDDFQCFACLSSAS